MKFDAGAVPFNGARILLLRRKRLGARRVSYQYSAGDGFLEIGAANLKIF